jgi:hypothetical protein
MLNALSFNLHQAVIFGEILNGIVADEFLLDSTRGIVDAPKLDLFGAMHAARWYSTVRDRFEMVRPTWA